MTETVAANNKRIAKNTLLLYFRMLFTMTISLYTSRVVLNTLGITDFGLYNVVGGVIAMCGFLNAAMSSSTQRYLTFELGKNNFSQLQKIFSISVSIHILIAIIVCLLGETIGLWFLYHKIVIPFNRLHSALWVYQFSILTTIMMIISVPYNAAIIAHEKMSAFAYISVLEISLKLGIVFLLDFFDFDKLALYAILMFFMQLVLRFVYGIYCSKHFKETKYYWYWNKSLFKDMLSFAGWNLWGNCAAIAFTEGLNILLNMFFGPVVNAARGISVQVQGAISQFSMNFQMALNPQITKSYAKQDYDYMHSLIYRSSKFTFFLLFALSLPIFIETSTVLRLWLKTVPNYTVSFVRLMLCVTIIDAVSNSLMISASATGHVKRYQSIVGGCLLSILPISYFVLKLGASPSSVFIVHLCICILAFFVRLLIIRPMIYLSLVDYFNKVISRLIIVTLLALPLPLLQYHFLPLTIFSFFAVCVVSVCVALFVSYVVGLNKSERFFVLSKVRFLRSKLKHD